MYHHLLPPPATPTVVSHLCCLFFCQVLSLRDTNHQLKEQIKAKNGDDDEDALHELSMEAEKCYGITVAKVKELKEARQEYYDLTLDSIKMPDFTKNTGGPAKRGVLSMGKKKLECELIGGEQRVNNSLSLFDVWVRVRVRVGSTFVITPTKPLTASYGYVPSTSATPTKPHIHDLTLHMSI